MAPDTAATICRHCGRRIVNENGLWVDPEATGDDSVWRETCDANDTFTAEHEPDDGHEPTCSKCVSGVDPFHQPHPPTPSLIRGDGTGFGITWGRLP